MILPPSETIIETKKCRISGQEFVITDKDAEILESCAPSFNGKVYHFLRPTLCPDERQRRRLSWRNERVLYQRTCDFSGLEIVSVYHPDSGYKVYDQKVWWSDDWSSLDFARDFDFDRTFFDQYRDLLAVAPKLSLYSVNCINSEFTNFTINSRDCYLCVGVTNSEETLYANFCKDAKNVLDSTFCYECELVYFGMDLTRCYHCFYAKNSVNCRDCFGVDECSDCHHCIGCFGLRNKEYHVYNKPVSKEQFETIWSKALQHGGSLQILADLAKLRESQYVRNVHSINCQNCYGDQIENGKNGFACFDSKNIEEGRYTYFSPKNIYSMDVTYTAPEGCDHDYEVCSTLANNSVATFQFANGSHAYYSTLCPNSEHIFGCASIKGGRHAVMNKPYSVQEYETLCAKIADHMLSTGEWGEFFPTELSAFGYNETVAQEYYPLTESEARGMPRFGEWIGSGAPLGRGVAEGRGVAIEMGRGTKSEGVSLRERYEEGGCVGSPETLWTSAIPISHCNPPAQSATPLHRGAITGSGWNWRTESSKSFDGSSIHPLSIDKYDEKVVGQEIAQKNIDALLASTIVCEISGRPFKIIPLELAFYIENGISIPTKHPDQRHFERMQLRNPRKLFERTCMECQKEIVTTYSPERKEKIVCEECYRKLVY